MKGRAVVTDEIPSAQAYAEAKARYQTWTPAQHQRPTSAMLADVATINAYERVQDYPPLDLSSAVVEARMPQPEP